MKKTNLYYIGLTMFLFSIACKKTNPEVIPVIAPEKDKLIAVTWKFDTFMVDNQNVSTIYPGAIFSIKQNGEELEAVPLQNQYTPLPITASTSLTSLANKSFHDLPSFGNTYEYIKNLTGKTALNSQVYTEDEFKDYNVIKYFLSNNSDVKSVFKNIGLEASTRISRKHAVYFYSNNERFTLDMNLPRKTELLSEADAEKLRSENAYYINGVSYGNNSLILAEGDADYITLKLALKALLNGKELTGAQTQGLSNAKITFYSRAGEKESFIKVANGLTEIKSTLTDFDAFNNRAAAYPISYSLRSINNFTLFNQSLTINIIN